MDMHADRTSAFRALHQQGTFVMPNPWDVEAVAPKPVNVLVWGGFLPVAELATLGVRRISTGSHLAATAWGAAMRAAAEIAEQGTFDGLNDAPGSSDIVRGFSGQ